MKFESLTGIAQYVDSANWRTKEMIGGTSLGDHGAIEFQAHIDPAFAGLETKIIIEIKQILEYGPATTNLTIFANFKE